jgi:heme a synthase
MQYLSLHYLVFPLNFPNTGAIVAGLDAGLIYNEFPMMGNSFIPPTKELFNPHYTHTDSPSHISILLHNIGQNPVLAQLDHRVLGVATFTLTTLYWLRCLRRPFPAAVKRGMNMVMAAATLQVALGISTLVYMVPTHVAASHQAGALVYLTAVLILVGRLRVPSLGKLIK